MFINVAMIFFQFTSAQIVSIPGAALQAYVQLIGTSGILKAMLFLGLLIGLDFKLFQQLHSSSHQFPF